VRQNAPVSYHKLESTDAFYVVDFDEAPSTGIVRCAKKILRDGAESFARAQTYAFASFDIQMSGASAGINAVGDGRDEAVQAFVGELAARDGAPIHLTPGKGTTSSDLDALSNGSGSATPTVEPIAATAIAAAGAARSLDGASVALDLEDELGSALRSSAETAGAQVVATGSAALTAECDIVFVGSAPAAIDHEAVASLQAGVVVPVLHKAVSTRAISSARRAEIIVLPEFVCTSGPTLRRWAEIDGPTAAAKVAAVIGEVLDHPEGPVLGACERAEAFLGTWQDIPFGRPI